MNRPIAEEGTIKEERKVNRMYWTGDEARKTFTERRVVMSKVYAGWAIVWIFLALISAIFIHWCSLKTENPSVIFPIFLLTTSTCGAWSIILISFRSLNIKGILNDPFKTSPKSKNTLKTLVS